MLTKFTKNMHAPVNLSTTTASTLAGTTKVSRTLSLKICISKENQKKLRFLFKALFPSPLGLSLFFSFRYYRFRSFILNGFAKGIILYEGRIGCKDKKYYEIAKRGAERRT